MRVNFKGGRNTGKTYKISDFLANLLINTHTPLTVLFVDVVHLGERSFEQLVTILNNYNIKFESQVVKSVVTFNVQLDRDWETIQSAVCEYL